GRARRRSERSAVGTGNAGPGVIDLTRPLPLVGAPRRLPAIPVHEHMFANGMRAVVVERRDLPIVDIEVVVMRGGALDTPANAGRVSITAEMLDEGTPTRDAIEIA